MSAKQAVLFVSHGSPTFAVEPGLAGPQLQALGASMPRPVAIVVISPHWMTRGGALISAARQQETIHDFGGFPAELYTLQYPAQGAPELAARVAGLLGEAGFATGLDEARGLDHGAWVPLRYLYPNADVPVFQIAMPYPLDTRAALALGRALRPLRDEGVLILASGSLTHNLYEIRREAGASGTGDAEMYALAFTSWVRAAVQARNWDRLADYRRLAPDAVRSHPTEEHFLPLLIAAGATDDDEAAQVFDGGVTYGVLAMESYAWGAPLVNVAGAAGK
ncbi:4,5-DOPA dioxygenase extradiol [Kerstersia gyiorum]|uniref:4,5-DOPA dioxygenase extradiol n=1 Tax=Kerstersia gyiorum TaxID=206506 RepID=A0A4Q7MWA7_9BURK|nr:class III extradiol ring-cleavage dioxygenase [Kerstersia gyiorum]KAB0544095.1 dioxygenase [Kerstersia gyiorum]RZS73073.1 4,5-DOPA dioxygenase extradiol [Kerstersia gyiorum]